MSIETAAEFEGVRAAGRAAADVLSLLTAATEPGISPAELDRLGARRLRALGAKSAPMLDVGFPAATCISVNDRIAHGIPAPVALRSGDLVNIDVSVELNGFYADTGASISVGIGSAQSERLCRVGREALEKALSQVRSGALLNQIGRAAERTARANGFDVIRDLCGHGLGRSLHEEPGNVYGYFEPRDRRRLTEGLVLAIEPFVSTGSRYVRVCEDGWTLRTSDGGIAVQYEHTIVVREEGALVLTAPEPFLVEATSGSA